MTEPSSARPLPGPPRPGPPPGARPDGGAAPTGGRPASHEPRPADSPSGEPFADLDERPVAEHVAVFEEEHSRLRRELGTIDQL
jgi:hypothetical protein